MNLFIILYGSMVAPIYTFVYNAYTVYYGTPPPPPVKFPTR